LGEALRETADPKEIFLALAARYITDACDALREVYDEGLRRVAAARDAHSNAERSAAEGRAAAHVDGFVSIEVDPVYAYDTEATTAEANRLHAIVDRTNLPVKIPGTSPGLPASEDMISTGKSINVTLIFSVQRYTEVAEAYVRGLERLIAAG